MQVAGTHASRQVQAEKFRADAQGGLKPAENILTGLQKKSVGYSRVLDH